VGLANHKFVNRADADNVLLAGNGHHRSIDAFQPGALGPGRRITRRLTTKQGYPNLSSLRPASGWPTTHVEDDEITPLAEETHRAASSNRVCR
jgi:hypothetical protein